MDEELRELERAFEAGDREAGRAYVEALLSYHGDRDVYTSKHTHPRAARPGGDHPAVQWYVERTLRAVDSDSPGFTLWFPGLHGPRSTSSGAVASGTVTAQRTYEVGALVVSGGRTRDDDGFSVEVTAGWLPFDEGTPTRPSRRPAATGAEYGVGVSSARRAPRRVDAPTWRDLLTGLFAQILDAVDLHEEKRSLRSLLDEIVFGRPGHATAFADAVQERFIEMGRRDDGYARTPVGPWRSRNFWGAHLDSVEEVRAWREWVERWVADRERGRGRRRRNGDDETRRDLERRAAAGDDDAMLELARLDEALDGKASELDLVVRDLVRVQNSHLSRLRGGPSHLLSKREVAEAAWKAMNGQGPFRDRLPFAYEIVGPRESFAFEARMPFWVGTGLAFVQDDEVVLGVRSGKVVRQHSGDLDLSIEAPSELGAADRVSLDVATSELEKAGILWSRWASRARSWAVLRRRGVGGHDRARVPADVARRWMLLVRGGDL